MTTSTWDYALQIEVASLSDTGLKRSVNQDSYIVSLPTPKDSHGEALFVVADGVGGNLPLGELASATAVKAFQEAFRATSATVDLESRIVEAVQVTNNAVRAAAEQAGVPAIGTTIVGIILLPTGEGMVFNVGDSRAYRLIGEDLKVISEDQVVTPLGGNPDGKRTTRIASFIGQSRPLTANRTRFTVQAGETYLICSDGIWGMMPESQLKNIIAHHPPEEAVSKLKDAVFANGATDNLTAIVLRTKAPKVAPKSLLPRLGIGIGALVAIGIGVGAALGIFNPSAALPPDNATPISQALGESTSSASAEAIELVPSDTATLRPSRTPIPPSVTPTDLPPTATRTPIPPSATPTPSNTPRPTRTPIPATATRTPIPPSPTASPMPPSATPSPSRTPSPVPASATNTPSNTPRPSRTPIPPSPTASDTPAPTVTLNATLITFTPAPTNTNTPRPTRTPSPTASASPTATLTPSATASPSATPTPNAATATALAQQPTVRIDNPQGVRVRRGAGEGFESPFGLEDGAVALILGQARGTNGRLWLRIDFEGRRGWIASDVTGLVISADLERVPTLLPPPTYTPTPTATFTPEPPTATP